MERLEPREERLLRTVCQSLGADLNKPFDFVQLGASLAMSRDEAEDVAAGLDDKRYFQPLSYGTEATLDRDGREYARTMSATEQAENAIALRAASSRLAAGTQPVRVFISHSSKDKPFAERLEKSLLAIGFETWIDKSKIKVGESIPAKIQDGLVNADYIVVLLSRHSIASRWVEEEWMTKYWDQVNAGKVMVLPALIEPCDRPKLLQDKKYADFTKRYEDGLSELADAMGPTVPSSTSAPSVNMSGGLPIAMTNDASRLLAMAHGKGTQLSVVLVEALKYARQWHRGRLEQFCRQELQGERDKSEDVEDEAAKRPWRVTEAYASRIGQLNTAYPGFQTEALMFQHIESRPETFVPMRFIWNKTVGDIEDHVAELLPETTAIVVHRKHGELMANSKTPDADVYVYMRRDTMKKILAAIRRELINRLLAELPAIEST